MFQSQDRNLIINPTGPNSFSRVVMDQLGPNRIPEDFDIFIATICTLQRKKSFWYISLIYYCCSKELTSQDKQKTKEDGMVWYEYD